MPFSRSTLARCRARATIDLWLVVYPLPSNCTHADHLSNRAVLKQFPGTARVVGMPLKFTPAPAIYAADRQMVRFLPRDEGLLVPCAVTGRALAAVAPSHSLEKTDPLLVYRTFKARNRAAAQEKYRKRLMEEDGIVIVRRKDLRAV
jgi:hypothetical protein